MSKKEIFICPVCGAEVAYGAKVCPQCGSDDQTGWSDHAYLDGIDIPDSDDYQEALTSEFGDKQHTSRLIAWQTIVGIIVAIVFIVLLFRSAAG